MGSMADVYFRGGPDDGVALPLPLADGKESLWFQNGATGESHRYRRTSATVNIKGVVHTVFEYASE